MAQITYTDKVALNENAGVADINKVNASDMNEIKSVVNGIVTDSYSTDTETAYSTNYINTALTPYTYSGSVAVSSGSMAASGWRNINSSADNTPSLEAGTYLVLYCVRVYSSSTGSAVARAVIDNSALDGQPRTAFPIQSGLTTMGTDAFLYTFTAGVHTIRFDVYASTSFTLPGTSLYSLIKL